MSKADFALQWLDYLGVSIYNHNGVQMFDFDGKEEYDILPLETQIKVGQQIEDEEDDDEPRYTTLYYNDLLRLGYIVVAEYNPARLWKPRQKCCYLIRRKQRNTVGLTYDNFRKIMSYHGIQVQHDPANKRLRLIGDSVYSRQDLRVDSGIGPWIRYEDTGPIVDYKRKGPLDKDAWRQARKNRMFGHHVVEEEFIDINEIPLLLSEEKYIVCLPKLQTCARMLVTGEPGMGKSTFTNAIAGRVFYKFEDRVGWLLDPLNQLYDLSLPQEYSVFNKINALINDEPRPMPVVQLHLASRAPLKPKNPNISCTLTLSFTEFLRKIGFYTYGIKEWDLGGAKRYMLEMINDVKDVSDVKELRDIFMERVQDAHKDKGKQSMIYKWVNTFESIFQKKFTSNLYQDDENATYEFEVEFDDGKVMKGHPFIMAMEAGIIPVLNIATCHREAWVRNYMADLMQKIILHQIRLSEAEQKRIWIIADELNVIYETGKRKDNASAAMEELFRQGRVNKIGFIGNTQSLDKINPEMYKNATHICCCYMKDHKERKKVGDTFNLPKEVYNKIEELKEQEMMIFSKQPFVVYDRWGRRRVMKDRGWFRGKIIPPVNYHYSPKGA